MDEFDYVYFLSSLPSYFLLWKCIAPERKNELKKKVNP